MDKIFDELCNAETGVCYKTHPSGPRMIIVHCRSCHCWYFYHGSVCTKVLSYFLHITAL